MSLLKAEHLNILKQLYGTILIPKAVYRELTENPIYQKEGEIIESYMPWSKKPPDVCCLKCRHLLTSDLIRDY